MVPVLYAHSVYILCCGDQMMTEMLHCCAWLGPLHHLQLLLLLAAAVTAMASCVETNSGEL